MAAVTAMNGANFFGESVSEPQTIEQQALEFFRRAEMSDSPNAINDWNDSEKPASPPKIIEQQALDFFWRAELSATLESIWTIIKRQRISALLKLMKAVALITAVILFSQSISIAGLLTFVGSIAGLLFAAITNALVWFIYVPLYFVAPSDFGSSVLFAIGLVWLGGIGPFVALVFSPVLLFGFRLLEQAEVAQAHVSELPGALGKAFDSVNLGATFLQGAGNAASAVSKISRRFAKAALLPAKVQIPTIA